MTSARIAQSGKTELTRSTSILTTQQTAGSKVQAFRLWIGVVLLGRGRRWKGSEAMEPSRIPADIGKQAAARSSTKSSSANGTSLAQSPTGQIAKPDDFATSMAHLCAMKRTAQLTELQLDTWHSVLGGFRIEIINASVIEMVLSDARFPELGDLYRICKRKAVQAGDMQLPYSPNSGDKENDRPTKAEISAVADRLGLKV